MKPLSKLVFLFPALIIGLTACESRQTGHRGQLSFAYSTTQDVENFNKPIAVGGTLEMRINVVGSDEDPTVKHAFTRKDGPLVVSDKGLNLVELKAKKPGGSFLKVMATDEAGKPYRDFVHMRAARVAKINVQHLCTGKRHAYYMANSRNLALPYSKRSAKNEPLIGYGVYPMSIKPAGAASIRRNNLDDDSVVIDIEPNTKKFTIESPLMKAPLSFETIKKSDINSMIMDPFDRFARTTVKRETYVEFYPLYNKERPCNAEMIIEAKSLTPDICEATPDLYDDGDGATNIEGFVRIKGLKFGICKYKVWFPEAQKGVEGTYTLEVGQYPSDVKKESKATTIPAIKELESEDPLAQNVPRIYAERNPHPLSPRNKPWWFTPLLALMAPLLLGPVWLWRRKNN